MLTALASGDYELFKEFCPYIRNLKEKALPWTRCYFRVLRDFVCEDGKDLPEALSDMKEYFEKKYKSHVGYAEAFEAILKKDEVGFKKAFDRLMKDHRRLCRPGGMFGSTEHQDIAIWALGVANLARFRGLKAQVGSYEMLPEELIVTV